MQRLTREEFETHISMNAVDDTVIIETSIPKDIRKCLNQGYEVIREFRYEDGSICSMTFKAPRRVISLRNLTTMQKEPTEKQLEARKRFAEYIATTKKK